jgi:tRNA A37 threonylcarbamoyladenosine synthetase subunit TsaC/SUA5/YrdC
MLLYERTGPATRVNSRQAADLVADRIAAGGLAVIPWGAPQREIFVMVADCCNTAAIEKINQIKGRQPTQSLGVTTAPEVMDQLGDLQATPGLMRSMAATRFRRPLDYLVALFERGALAIVVRAREGLPQYLTSVGADGRPTILFVTELNYEDYPVLIETHWSVASRYGMVLAGTSANRSGQETYTVVEQQLALADLRPDVDAFLCYEEPVARIAARPFWKRVLSPLHLCSATMLDFTGTEPLCRRHGSLHPAYFGDLLPKWRFATDVAQHPSRQRRAQVCFDSLLRGMRYT